MNIPTTLSLPSDQPRPLRRAASTLVTVRRGTVWLTEPDSLEDRFLAAGDSHRIASDALVLIEAQRGAAEVLLQPPSGSVLARLLRLLGLEVDASGASGRAQAKQAPTLNAPAAR